MDELTHVECLQLLDEELVGHLGVVDGGTPYVTPVSYVRHESDLYFRTGPGRRLDVLRSNPSVCFEASSFDVEGGEWRSVVVWGDVTGVTDDETESLAVDLLLEKYRSYVSWIGMSGSAESLPGLSVVMRLPMEVVTGRSSGSGFSPRTRPGRL